MTETCWCHGQYGLTAPAQTLSGLCRACSQRSPSACKRAHEREQEQHGR